MNATSIFEHLVDRAGNQSRLGESLGASSRQEVHDWKRRGRIPERYWRSIAEQYGISIEKLYDAFYPPL